ncbi:hypothetical protein EJ08DRAFT_698439 [Tothia fuscella]|uniref:Uncharacterized protein n=1 Tax=Tothia fuscella TaxID=1048955 RepID=A0A9P4NPV1_9PEZI|nr:hypothetical protein EJ08DRAFT_698439 [Tothia fuscella]
MATPNGERGNAQLHPRSQSHPRYRDSYDGRAGNGDVPGHPQQRNGGHNPTRGPNNNRDRSASPRQDRHHQRERSRSPSRYNTKARHPSPPRRRRLVSPQGVQHSHDEHRRSSFTSHQKPPMGKQGSGLNIGNPHG